ncbi:MAG: DUF1569 domain-containing protein [Ferruginibacter sp.]
MDQQKLDFISHHFIPLLKTLPAESVGKWGKMNPQQMVEHVSGFFQVSTNKIHFPFVTPLEHLPKYIEFLRSDKPFRENTKAPILPDEPRPVRFANMEAAINDLEKEVAVFKAAFEKEPSLITQHPVFGDLGYDDWVLLHYKHISHHLKQFGLL